MKEVVKKRIKFIVAVVFIIWLVLLLLGLLSWPITSGLLGGGLGAILITLGYRSK